MNISSKAADLAIQNAAMLMGSTDEWTDQQSMIADFQQRLDALIADLADAHAQKESWYALATRRQRELNEATATIARLSAKVEAAREALAPFARIRPSSFHPADGSESEAYTIILKSLWGNPQDFTGGDLALARAALAKLTEEA